MPYKKIYIITDGATRNNQKMQKGASAIGFGIYDENWKTLFEDAKHIGTFTNNEAEYKALIFALDKATEFCRNEVEHICDSLLIINQLNGEYSVKAKNLKPLIEEVYKKKQYFKQVIHKHLPRTNPKIKRIDDLANLALNREGF